MTAEGQAVDATLAEFRAALERMRALGIDSPRAYNRQVDLSHKLAKQLRETARGRAGIESLIDDEDPAIALAAATEALAWDCGRSIAKLEALEHSGGLDALNAHYTLKMYREGTLNLDW